MPTFHLKVDTDGRVMIPDTRPGETVTIRVPIGEALQTVNTEAERAGPIPEEERAAIQEQVHRLAREIRAEMGNPDEQLSLTHGDLLYDDDGLPK